MKYINLKILVAFLILVSTGTHGQGGKKGSSPTAAQKKSIASTEDNKKFTIPANFNGYNAQMLRGPSWQAPGFIEKVKELHP